MTSIDDQAKGMALGADAYALKPVARGWLLDTLTQLVEQRRPPRLLVIDDDEISRYLVRARLADAPLTVQEVADGREGLREARAQRPSAIVLDLVMPEMTGFEVMSRLKEDPATSDIPVIVLTSRTLSDEERRMLAPHSRPHHLEVHAGRRDARRRPEGGAGGGRPSPEADAWLSRASAS